MRVNTIVVTIQEAVYVLEGAHANEIILSHIFKHRNKILKDTLSRKCLIMITDIRHSGINQLNLFSRWLMSNYTSSTGNDVHAIVPILMLPYPGNQLYVPQTLCDEFRSTIISTVAD